MVMAGLSRASTHHGAGDVPRREVHLVLRSNPRDALHRFGYGERGEGCRLLDGGHRIEEPFAWSERLFAHGEGVAVVFPFHLPRQVGAGDIEDLALVGFDLSNAFGRRNMLEKRAHCRDLRLQKTMSARWDRVEKCGFGPDR